MQPGDRWWQISDRDRFQMVTDYICQWQNHYVGNFFVMLGFFNVFNRSFKSQSCHHFVSNINHQHRCSHSCHQDGIELQGAKLLKNWRVAKLVRSAIIIPTCLAEKTCRFSSKVIGGKLSWSPRFQRHSDARTNFCN